MLNKEDYAVIKSFKGRGVYLKDIAEELGVHTKTVSRALKRGGAPHKMRKKRGSKLDPHKATVDRLLSEGVWNAVVILREIIPLVGDTFTVLEKWMDMDEHGKVVKVNMQEGDTLTFGEQPFEWEELDAAPGEYIVGFIAEDLDGNSFPVYTQVTVK